MSLDYCGVNSPCQSSGSFIYNNTVYVPSTIRPEIVFQSGSGETKFYNNLVYVEPGANPIFTSLASQGVQYDISHNLFYPYSAFSLANGLTDNALFLNPKLRNLVQALLRCISYSVEVMLSMLALLSIPRLTHLITATIMVGLITLAMLFLILCSAHRRL